MYPYKPKAKPFYRVYSRWYEKGKWEKWKLLATFKYKEDAECYVRYEINDLSTDLTQYDPLGTEVRYKIMHRNRNERVWG